MTKESLGKRVKSFTASIPTASAPLETERETVPIYFKAGESSFYAYIPPHIADAIGKHPEAGEAFQPGKAAVTSPLADRIEPAFNHVVKLYSRMQRDQAKRKVIRVHFQANHPYANRMPPGLVLSNISFAPSPAISMWHQVLYQVGDGLYRASERRDGGLADMSYICAVPKETARPNASRETFLLDWTAEREAFFVRMREGLLTLTERIAFLLAGDTGGNVDQLIATGGLALPAPGDVNPA